MKFVIFVLVVTHRIDYFIMDDLVFNSYRECFEFQRYMNQQPPDSKYVLWCGRKNERKNK